MTSLTIDPAFCITSANRVLPEIRSRKIYHYVKFNIGILEGVVAPHPGLDKESLADLSTRLFILEIQSLSLPVLTNHDYSASRSLRITTLILARRRNPASLAIRMSQPDDRAVAQ